VCLSCQCLCVVSGEIVFLHEKTVVYIVDVTKGSCAFSVRRDVNFSLLKGKIRRGTARWQLSCVLG